MFRTAPIASVDDVIDPVESEKPDENQVDSHCEAHDPGRNQQEHSRGQASDRQKRLGSIEVHPGAYSRFGCFTPGRRGRILQTEEVKYWGPPPFGGTQV